MMIPGVLDWRNRWALRPPGLAMYVFALAAGCLLIIGGSNTQHRLTRWGPPRLWDLAALTWGAVLLAWVVRSRFKLSVVARLGLDSRKAARDRWARRFTSVVFFLSVIGSAWNGGSWTFCPHASYYQVWRIGGVAISSTGGPCHNHASSSAHLGGRWYLYFEE